MKKNNFMQFEDRFICMNDILEIQIDSEDLSLSICYGKSQDFKVKTIYFEDYEFYFIKSKIMQWIDQNNKSIIQKLIEKVKRKVQKYYGDRIQIKIDEGRKNIVR